MQVFDAKSARMRYNPLMDDLPNALREDRVEPSLSREEALENATGVRDGFFCAPREESIPEEPIPEEPTP